MTVEHKTHVCDGPPCSQCQAMLDQLPTSEAGRHAIISLFDAAVNNVKLPKATTACAIDDDSDHIVSVAIGVTDPHHPKKASVAVITDPAFQRQGYGSAAVAALADTLFDNGVTEIEADISGSNPASQHLATSLSKKAPPGVKTLFRNILRG